LPCAGQPPGRIPPLAGVETSRRAQTPRLGPFAGVASLPRQGRAGPAFIPHPPGSRRCGAPCPQPLPRMQALPPPHAWPTSTLSQPLN